LALAKLTAYAALSSAWQSLRFHLFTIVVAVVAARSSLYFIRIDRLADPGDAGTKVLERLLLLTQPDNPRFILVGLTSQAALPLSIQQLTQEKDCVKPIMLTMKKLHR
jgi:hypothetical protein